MLSLAAPPVFCGLGAANRSNQKQLEWTAAARTPGLTGLVQQVLRGEADTRLTAVSAHTDGRLTQDGKKKERKEKTVFTYWAPKYKYIWDSNKAT